MDAAIPPTGGKREADLPTAEEEPDSKKLKHGEEEDLMHVFERLKSDCLTELHAKGKLMEYVVFCNRKLTPEEETFLSQVMEGYSPLPSPSTSPPPLPVPMPPSPDDDDDDDDEQGYGSHDELPPGYGWVSYDPYFFPKRKDFVAMKWCARCGMAKDHWANKCTEKQGEGSYFKRAGWHEPPSP